MAEKCLIIGSGPAGYTAAIYAARANMSPVLYTGATPGGQLMITNDVENFPGYPQGVHGPQMMADLQQQAERFGTRIHYGVRIEKVDLTGPVHRFWTDGGEAIEAHTVIIATGAEAKWLGLSSEQKYVNNGVSACAVCDGFFYRGQEVAVVGGGDTAAEEATYLSKLCPRVHLLVRRDSLRASKIMQERVLGNDKITVHWFTEVDEVVGDGEKMTGLRVINNQTDQKGLLSVTGLFVAIGHKPNTELFKDWLEMDEAGYLVTKGKTTHTRIPGVYACGDAQDNVYRQAVTAAGTGCMAALDAERYLAAGGVI
jgi:thioredoxin reductase (NADPH)